VSEQPADGLVVGEERLARCWWGAGDSDEYRAYHDNEWGRPVVDDTRLFEKLCLEGFQAGLSWLTILRKREAFRAAFAGFDPTIVAGFGADDVERLLGDAGIVRHRGKIESAINNAGRALELASEHGSLAAFFWGWEPDEGRPETVTYDWLMKQAQTETSRGLAKELKRRGWTFVGPTTVYAFMQAMGLVNDHLEGCHARAPCLAARAALTVPSGG
jgi:DNA-3-methyladenine glycosylase I